VYLINITMCKNGEVMNHIDTDSVGIVFAMLAIMFIITVWVIPSFISVYGVEPYVKTAGWGLIGVCIASVIGMAVKNKQ
jgi:hypothetical protein